MDEACFDIASPIFLARLADRLSTTLEEQTAEVFNRYAIEIPVRSCSLMVTIANLGTASPAELSTALGQSHQLVAQKIPKLLKLRLISQSKDPNDARRKIFKVTKKGHEQLQKFAECSSLIQLAYSKLFAEVGDLHSMLNEVNKLLQKTSMIERLEQLQTTKVG